MIYVPKLVKILVLYFGSIISGIRQIIGRISSKISIRYNPKSNLPLWQGDHVVYYSAARRVAIGSLLRPGEETRVNPFTH